MQNTSLLSNGLWFGFLLAVSLIPVALIVGWVVTTIIEPFIEKVKNGSR